MRIIHVSDFHLRDPTRSRSAARHADFLAACLQKLGETCFSATCCVVTGDLADDGDPKVYHWLRGELQGLPFPVVPLLGNHDNREAFRQGFGDCGFDENGFVQGELDTPEAKFVFLDTLKTGSDAGTLCKARLSWLRHRLQNSKGRNVLLFMHHPPCRIGDKDLDPLMLDNADEFGQILEESGNVRHIFFGHVHRNIFVNWNGIPSTSLEGPQALSAGPQTKLSMAVSIVDLDGNDLRVSKMKMDQILGTTQP